MIDLRKLVQSLLVAFCIAVPSFVWYSAIAHTELRQATASISKLEAQFEVDRREFSLKLTAIEKDIGAIRASNIRLETILTERYAR